MHYVNNKGKTATTRKVRNLPLYIWRENTHTQKENEYLNYYFTKEQIEEIIKTENWMKVDRRTVKKIIKQAYEILRQEHFKDKGVEYV